MLSDEPAASWHPAMMPNTIADLPKDQPVLSPILPEHSAGAPEDEPSNAHVESNAADDLDGGADAWLAGEESGENWLGEEPNPEVADSDQQPADETAATELTTNEVDNVSTTNSKHLSTMSFTRTVSHEVNFNDDDETDADFEFSRTGTDPFKFMPPNDRTNSFPAVPPLESQTEQALPPTQAEEIIHELDQEQEDEDDFFAKAAQGANDEGFLDDEVEGAAPQYIGGDLHGTTEEASEARFTEGIPLIPHGQDGGEPQTTVSSSFMGDEGEEDSFFAQVRGDEASAPLEAPEPGLQRISTVQVLNGMGIQPIPSSLPTAGEEQTENVATAGESKPKVEAGEDLDAKWKAMFAGDEDDDFLLDDGTGGKSVDPEGFLGSDDEGLLDDKDDFSAQETQPASQPAQPREVNGQYIPPGQTANYTPAPVNPYAPVAPQAPFAAASPSTATQKPPPFGFGTPPPRPEPVKAESFADRSKGGYTSPYDLPMDVVQPRKRVSMQNLQRNNLSQGSPPMSQAPPRSASLQAHSTPPTSVPPPGLTQSTSAPPIAPKQATEAKRGDFFQDLPIASRPRPASRQSNQSLPSPSQTSPYGPPKTNSPPPMTLPPQAQPHLGEISRLVAPDRVGPYAPLNGASAPTAPTALSNRYSPAPAAAPNGVVPAALSNRYSPAPGSVRPPSGGYTPSGINGASVLPHQPRTSSPLAHFEISHGKNQTSNYGETGLGERRSSSALHESRLQRVPSLPPTSEVDEEDGSDHPQSFPSQLPPMAPPSQRYAQVPRARQTPPPPGSSPQSTLSPPKRSASSFGSVRAAQDFAPPARSQTQSPGALHGEHRKSADPIQRPSSVHSPTSPSAGGYMPTPISQVTQVPPPGMAAPVTSAVQTAPAPRARGFSQNFSLIPPTDGRENDPLQRWRGSPLFAWGVGGTMVTMFPKDVPRYGINQSVPTVMRSPGEVKIKSMKDSHLLEERLSKFPGPLKAKSKKKETISWLSTGIEDLERLLPQTSFQSHLSHEDKRATERILLWKILRVFIEFDGALEGNAAVDKAVRELLSPNLSSEAASAVYTTGAGIAELTPALETKTQADAVDSSTVEQIRTHLLGGDREKAVWAAVDKRLWGHAMLIANTVSPDLYMRVAQEFVKKEVNFPGHNNESLAALYGVLSGNHEESVDELVPVHARAGLQLMAKNSNPGASSDALAGLDKWRETLGLILSNRSPEDAKAINSLGNLLSGYGRAEAAHICFLFARSHSIFGGLDDPSSNFVLVGSDHKRQVEQFAKESEPLLLSEVYEYGLSLAGGSNLTITSPHLAGYKFQHALTLAEYGFRDKALQYCEAISSAITAQTRRSPYHHAVLEATVDDLMKRLKQAPKEESNSWIRKPSMNKVSDSVWNRFNKFVAGEESESSGPGAGADGDESGPFARLTSGTPTISRPPSTSNFETFGATIPGYPMANTPHPALAPMTNTKAGSRYTPSLSQPMAAGNSYEPSSAYAPRAPSERGSSEINRGSFEMPRQSTDLQSGSYGNPYAPLNHSLPNQGYQPAPETGYAPTPEYPPSLPVSQPGQQLPTASLTSGYEPLGYASAPTNGVGYQPTGSLATVGESLPSSQEEASAPSAYQAPSYGYEPPSLTSFEPLTSSEEETSAEATNGSSYEPPSFQSYEPPSYKPYNPPAEDGRDSDDEKTKRKPRGIMYDDDDDDFPAARAQEKSKADKDRENQEMFRKIAEEEAKADAEKKAAAAKKGWGFGGWFAGAKKEAMPQESPGAGAPNKPIRAKLGEANSFYFDPDLKRWVNKNTGPEDNVKKATPPPPKGPPGAPRSATSTPPPPAPTSHPDLGRASAPPTGPPRSLTPSSLGPPSVGSAPPGGAPPMMRSASGASVASGPPSRPATALSTTSSIDDLLGPAGLRTKGPKKSRKSGRYVDVMAKP